MSVLPSVTEKYSAPDNSPTDIIASIKVFLVELSDISASHFVLSFPCGAPST